MHNKCILLVDDEPQLLEVNKEALEACSYTVRTANNGVDALSVLDSERVDLVVSDLRMPKLGGQEMLQEIRKRKLDVDIIFLTGYATVESAVDCIRLGAADYLQKPFNIQNLLAKIESVLGEREIRKADHQGNLDTVLQLSAALRNQRDTKSLIKELLLQIRDTFAPDAMGLFLTNGIASEVGKDMLWGPILTQNERAQTWFKAVSERLMLRGKPKLFDSLAITHGTNKIQVAAMVCPIIDATGPMGAMIVLRDIKRGPYSMPSLRMLSVFASHAATALEGMSARSKLNDINLDIITSHVCSVEAKDFYTKGHSERVGAYAAMLGREAGLPEHEIELLSFAGILHDVGKIGIPDKILNKPKGLTEAEFSIMMQHPIMGRDILANIQTLKELLPIVYHHHEWVDGSGYPDRLKGDSVPFLARIVAIADGFEAMTSDRAYQPARPISEAIRILRNGSGTQWDEQLVKIWTRLVEKENFVKEHATLMA